MGNLNWTAVGRTVDDAGKTVGVTLISSSYEVQSVKIADVVAALKGKKIGVTNLELKGNDVVFSNGAEKNYTAVSATTGQLVNKPAAVILDRIEQDGKVVAYTVFTPNGSVEKIPVGKAVEATNAGIIANGKIRHTAEGDIVSSIKGNYNLCLIDSNKVALKSKDKVEMTVLFYAKAFNGSQSKSYAGMIIRCKSAAKISKVMDIVKTQNAKLVSALEKIGEQDTDSLKTQRISICEFYVIVDTKTVAEIIRKFDGEFTKVLKIMISVLEFDIVNVEPVQSTAVIDNAFKVTEIKAAAGMENDVTEFISELSKEFR